MLLALWVVYGSFKLAYIAIENYIWMPRYNWFLNTNNPIGIMPACEAARGYWVMSADRAIRFAVRGSYGVEPFALANALLEKAEPVIYSNMYNNAGLFITVLVILAILVVLLISKK